MQMAEEQIAIDLGDEYEQALSDATQEEIIDLAAILGFHQMMNQDQYHASLLNKNQPIGMGWDGLTKATKPKIFPQEPPNATNPDETIKRVKDNDNKLTELNWNNIKVSSRLVPLNSTKTNQKSVTLSRIYQTRSLSSCLRRW